MTGKDHVMLIKSVHIDNDEELKDVRVTMVNLLKLLLKLSRVKMKKSLMVMVH